MSFFSNLFRRSSSREVVVPDITEILQPLPSNEEIMRISVKSARKMRRASRDLEPAFVPLETNDLTELDEKEQFWCEKALERSGLSESHYPKDVWEQIVDTFGINRGLNEAAKARLQEGDYSGALGSWVKWICTFNPGLQGRPIDHVSKEDWLILVRIYIGLCCSEGARKAMAWAKTSGDVEEYPKGTPKSVRAFMKAKWEGQIEEVGKEIDFLN